MLSEPPDGFLESQPGRKLRFSLFQEGFSKNSVDERERPSPKNTVYNF
jgi:hypothetical protein